MGVAASKECFARRDRQCCDLNDSIFGEDAFYRDAARDCFFDCNEGNPENDKTFSSMREQATLKMRKGSVFATYASFEIQRRTSRASLEFKQCLAAPRPFDDENEEPPTLTRRTTSTRVVPDGRSAWLGSTVPEWKQAEMPLTGDGPYWSKGNGLGLKMRSGPDYMRQGNKIESSKSLYEALSVDTIKASTKITSIVGSLVDPSALPEPPASHCESDRSGGGSPRWTAGCPLPRVICLHCMMPYESGIIPWKADPGCSFVVMLHIKPETIQALRSDSLDPFVKLFKDFCDGPAGVPGGDVLDPNRSLAARMQDGKKKDQQSGLFKIMAYCMNPHDVHVPDMFHTYNGKPCLITKCGYVVKDPAGEWMEIGFDVRGFNVLARKMLSSFRSMLPKTKIHYGCIIQGTEDDELPEGLLCDMSIFGCNMEEDPLDVTEFLQGRSSRS